MSEKENPFAGVTKTFQGRGETLDAAIESAWKHAEEHKAGPGLFRVVDIYFRADNPIREYSVVIGGVG